MNRNPAVDQWLDEAGHPLDAAMRRAREIGKLVRTMRFADLAQLEAGRAELEAVIRAWCAWKAGSQLSRSLTIRRGSAAPR